MSVVRRRGPLTGRSFDQPPPPVPVAGTPIRAVRVVGRRRVLLSQVLTVGSSAGPPDPNRNAGIHKTRIQGQRPVQTIRRGGPRLLARPSKFIPPESLLIVPKPFQVRRSGIPRQLLGKPLLGGRMFLFPVDSDVVSFLQPKIGIKPVNSFHPRLLKKSFSRTARRIIAPPPVLAPTGNPLMLTGL